MDNFPSASYSETALTLRLIFFFVIARSRCDKFFTLKKFSEFNKAKQEVLWARK